jgi:hypothetical protein
VVEEGLLLLMSMEATSPWLELCPPQAAALPYCNLMLISRLPSWLWQREDTYTACSPLTLNNCTSSSTRPHTGPAPLPPRAVSAAWLRACGCSAPATGGPLCGWAALPAVGCRPSPRAPRGAWRPQCSAAVSWSGCRPACGSTWRLAGSGLRSQTAQHRFLAALVLALALP